MVRLVLFSTAIYMAVFKRHSFWAKNITIMSYNYPLNSEKCPTSFHFMYDFFFLIQTMLDKISHKFLPRKMSEICCACKKSRTLYGSDIICNFPYRRRTRFPPPLSPFPPPIISSISDFLSFLKDVWSVLVCIPSTYCIKLPLSDVFEKFYLVWGRTRQGGGKRVRWRYITHY